VILLPRWENAIHPDTEKPRPAMEPGLGLLCLHVRSPDTCYRSVDVVLLHGEAQYAAKASED
jgi:hypothetical protein